MTALIQRSQYVCKCASFIRTRVFEGYRWMSCDCSNLGQFSMYAFRNQSLGFMPGPGSGRNLMQIILKEKRLSSFFLNLTFYQILTTTRIGNPLVFFLSYLSKPNMLKNLAIWPPLHHMDFDLNPS